MKNSSVEKEPYKSVMLQVPKSYQNTVKHELRNAYRLVTECLYMTTAEGKGFAKVFEVGEVPEAMCTWQFFQQHRAPLPFTHCMVQVSRQKIPACNCHIDPEGYFL